MEWGTLSTTALATSAASLFMRWRFPTVHPVLASAGVGAFLTIAALSLLQPPLSLAISVALNAALTAGLTDYAIWGRKQVRSNSVVESLLELRFHGDGRIPTGIQTKNIWRWFALDYMKIEFDPETREHSVSCAMTTLFITFDYETTIKICQFLRLIWYFPGMR